MSKMGETLMTMDYITILFRQNWNEAIEKAADLAPDTHTKEQIRKLKKEVGREQD